MSDDAFLDSNQISLDDLEQAFLKEKVNMTSQELDGTVTNIQSTGNGVIITKEINVDNFLHNAKLERDNFRMSNKTDDHMTKVASIPRLVYEQIMAVADKEFIFDKRDRQKFLIEALKQPQYESFLSIPKKYIRG